MFITVHAATAAVISKNIPNPLIAFLVGFFLHFILDIIPHGDKKMGKKFFGVELKELKQEDDFKKMALYGSLDAACLAIFLIFLFRTFDFANSDSVSWGMIGGILPDILVVTYKLGKFKWLKWFDNLHHKNHYFITNKLKDDISLTAGIIMQIIILSFLIFALYHI